MHSVEILHTNWVYKDSQSGLVLPWASVMDKTVNASHTEQISVGNPVRNENNSVQLMFKWECNLLWSTLFLNLQENLF